MERSSFTKRTVSRLPLFWEQWAIVEVLFDERDERAKLDRLPNSSAFPLAMPAKWPTRLEEGEALCCDVDGRALQSSESSWLSTPDAIL